MTDSPQHISRPEIVRRPLPLWKRLTFAAACVIGFLCIADATLQLIDLLIYGADHGRWLMQRRHEATEALVDMVHESHPEVVHPYVGFVLDPDQNEGVNEFGFVQIDGPVLKRNIDEFHVAMTGGSVARYLCEAQADGIRSRLESLLTHRAGRPIRVRLACCAQRGFRQPQQVMTWSYFQALGAQYDCVVNLDGFNEVALHPSENRFDELCYYYPRKWDLRVFNEDNGELNRLLFVGKQLRTRRRTWARAMAFADHVPFRLPLRAWHARDALLWADLEQAAADLSVVRQQQSHSYSASGPHRTFATDDERLDALADNWYRSSLLLSGLCRSQHSLYVHLLQPNLHLPESKQLTAEEQMHASRGADYPAVIAAGYPRLRALGEQLRAQQVAFFDATQLFANHFETVYADGCCHFNRDGNAVLSDYVCDCILRALDTQP